MLSSFIKTAIRNIRRDGLYSLIKITGLALGLGTSIVLFLYVVHQFSYDKDHPDIDRLYRVNQSHIWRPGGGVFHSTGPAVSFALSDQFPEIEAITRINTPGAYTMRYTSEEGKTIAFNENFDNVFAADSNFFSFFSFKLKEGNPATALTGKNKVILSDKAAKKFFGNEPALGKLIQLGEEVTPVGGGAGPSKVLVEVTGVTEAQAENIHFHFDYLLSMPTNPNVEKFEWSWIWTQVVTYIKVKPGTDIEAFQKKLENFGDRHAPATFEKIGMDYTEFLREKGHWSLYLQPVKDIHLYSGSPSDPLAIGNRLGRTGDIQYVYILGSVGAFILLIAVINFINLSTARAANRAKEVGVKKTLGVDRGSLVLQFQIEHIIITSLSMLLGLGAMEILRLLLLPLGIAIPLTDINMFWFVGSVALFAVITGLLAGMYPSFYLTSFRPAEVLKGRVARGFKSSGIRNALVVFQFAISIALMAGTLIVFQQLNYFLSADIGFEKENLLIIDRASRLGEQAKTFRDELAGYPEISSVALSADFRFPAEDIFTAEGDDKKITLSQYKIDEQFINTTQLQVINGRAFDENIISDKTGVVINVAAAKVLGWTPEEAIGKKVDFPADEVDAHTVIGVVRDFHFQSLHQNIAPTIFYHIDSPVWGSERVLLIKYKAEDLPKLVRKVENRWSQMVQATPLEYSFYDDDYKKQYEREEQMGSLFSIFTALSVVIAIIGLVGLVAYSAEQRKKEIGIRKVFGASFLRIYLMMNLHYFKLILIAIAIATPLTWYLMNQWLSGYAYRITIAPGIFILTGICEIIFALICVGYIAVRAASLNPSAVLKEE